MLYFIAWLVLSVASLGLCLGAFGTNTYRVLQSSDTGWIVRTGQHILSTGKLPEHDLFSWTCTKCDWVLYQWLFECAAGALFDAGGLWLVGFGSCIVLAVVLLYLLPRQWLSLGVPTFVTLAFAALSFTPHCFFARPQLVSYLCLALFSVILERARATGNTRRLWLLPPLMVLWVNCHSFWFIGLAMIAAYCLDGWLPVFRQWGKAADRSRQLVITQVLVVSAACVLVNPYGAGLIVYETSFLTEPDFLRLHELRPLLEEVTRADGLKPILDEFARSRDLRSATGSIYRFGFPFLVFLTAGWTLVIWRRRAIPLAGLLLMAAATLAALLMLRFAPVAAIVCWPFIGLALADLEHIWRRFPAPFDGMPARFRRGVERFRPRTPAGTQLSHLAHLCLVAAFASATWIWSFPDPQRTWLTHGGNRREGIEFLKSLGLGPRVFNDGSGGSNMILAGCLPVFIDTRFDVYGKNFCERWQACMDAEPGWQQYLQGLDVTHIFIGRYSRLHRALKSSQDWLCVYLDEACAIWIRKTPLPPFEERGQ